ncbi:molybdate ABC transporter substrate-binding protein [Litoribacillus peritrichatus]|uniref:Molybdate ABC transporter substrate-binding protein n=1 Tax=Litoribacillus peritrichatus TaxID=718191 RepID=A0ABP7N2M6_9GAMM
MKRYALLSGLFFFISCIQTAFGQSEESIHIAVASNFTPVMKELAFEFEKSTGIKVKASYGSSGKFVAQIAHGAPFQAFFSADQAKPKALEHQKLALPETRFTYAIGALVLWSTKQTDQDNLIAQLKNESYRNIAFANPKLAPYGAAALDVFRNLKLPTPERYKWLQGENIAQTYQFISTGNADLGFIALSQLKQQVSQPKGVTWEIPKHLYSPIKQDAVLLKRGQTSQATKDFLMFIHSKTSQEIIKSFGYDIP